MTDELPVESGEIFTDADVQAWAQTRPQEIRKVINVDMSPYELEREIVSLLTTANILVSNNHREAVFISGGLLSRIARHEVLDEEIFSVREFKKNGLSGRLATLADWQKTANNGAVNLVMPTEAVVLNVMERADELFTELPVLEQVVTCPMYSRDGVLQSKPGYSRDTRCWYAPPRGVDIGDVPKEPTVNDVRWALNMLKTELFGDFPFTDKSSLAHLIALTLLPFVRWMILGPTPMHAVDAPKAGTGKTLAAELAMTPAFGCEPQTTTVSTSEEEWKKQLTSVMLSGQPYVLFDNVPQTRSLSGGHLASTLTKDVYQERILGGNQQCVKPVRQVWVATGNNITYSDEMIRRTVPIYLNAHMETPHIGREFRHANVKRWAREHRGELIRACLTLVQSWITAERPRWTGKPLGKFEEWSAIMGGILEHLKVPGFLDNLSEFYDVAVDEENTAHAFVDAWYSQHGECEITCASLLDLAHVHLDLTQSVAGFKTRPTTKQLSPYMRKLSGQVFGNLEIVRKPVKGRADKYRLYDVSKTKKPPLDAS